MEDERELRCFGCIAGEVDDDPCGMVRPKPRMTCICVRGSRELCETETAALDCADESDAVSDAGATESEAAADVMRDRIDDVRPPEAVDEASDDVEVAGCEAAVEGRASSFGAVEAARRLLWLTEDVSEATDACESE